MILLKDKIELENQNTKINCDMNHYENLTNCMQSQIDDHLFEISNLQEAIKM